MVRNTFVKDKAGQESTQLQQNQKGGVVKPPPCVNYAPLLRRVKRRVLLLILDPQSKTHDRKWLTKKN